MCFSKRCQEIAKKMQRLFKSARHRTVAILAMGPPLITSKKENQCLYLRAFSTVITFIQRTPWLAVLSTCGPIRKSMNPNFVIVRGQETYG
jgi:hypothetical protein